ncbi:MAG: hypothetical protein WBP82_09125 [Leuconostoc mesenteroides]
MNKLKSNKSATIFNVEKVKNNKLPAHFLSAESRDITIDGQKTKVMINRDRSQYVAFQIDGQAYYIRDHKFFDTKESFESYVKPKSEKTKSVTMKQMIAAAAAAGLDLVALVKEQQAIQV